MGCGVQWHGRIYWGFKRHARGSGTMLVGCGVQWHARIYWGFKRHARDSGTCWWDVGFSGMLGYTGDSRDMLGVQGHAGGAWDSVA